jgi:hypothetical protein
MLQQRTKYSPYRHSWRLVAALATVILAVILAVQVLPITGFWQNPTPSPISDARAWGAYPRLTYRLPMISGERFIPTSLSSDGEQLGGYVLTPDGRGAIVCVVSLPTMAIRQIGLYHLAQPAHPPAFWVSNDYALIVTPDHKLIAYYNLLTHALIEQSEDQAAVLDTNLNNVGEAVDSQGIIPEEIPTSSGHFSLQLLNMFNGTHTFIATDVMPSLGFVGTYFIYGQDGGNVAMLYEVSTQQRTALPVPVAQALFAPSDTFVTTEAAAFFVKPVPGSQTANLYEIDKVFASMQPAVLPLATSLVRGTRLIAADDRLVLLNHQGRYFVWDLVLKRYIMLPGVYRTAGIVGNRLWMADDTQVTVVNTNGLPGR